METTTSRFQGNQSIEARNQILAEELEASLVNGKLPCAVAFKMTRKLNVTPIMVGDKANELKIRIVNCQMGCFDVEKATHNGLEDMEITTKLAEKVQASLINRELSCSEAFHIAEKLKVGRKQVGDTATKLNIKIVHCQLGCFS